MIVVVWMEAPCAGFEEIVVNCLVMVTNSLHCVQLYVWQDCSMDVLPNRCLDYARSGWVL
jgi:hypothetical protein